MPGSKSQRHAVRIRESRRRKFSIRSLFIRYRLDAHLKALGKEEWLREHSFEVESEGV